MDIKQNKTRILSLSLFSFGIVIGYLIPHPSTDNTAGNEISFSNTVQNPPNDSNSEGKQALDSTVLEGSTISTNNPFSEKLNIIKTVDPQPDTSSISNKGREQVRPALARPVSLESVLAELDLDINWNESDYINNPELASSEKAFLDHISKNPALISDLLLSYEKLEDGTSKDFLRSMLGASGSIEVERFVLNELYTGAEDAHYQWLNLLAGVGVRTTESRDRLLSRMETIAQPQNIALALKSLSPAIVPETERQNIVSNLNYYVEHSDAEIRSAGIEAMGLWTDKSNSYFIENALNDEVESVRTTAAISAYRSNIQSDAIKRRLIDLLGDERQSYRLRLAAYDALGAYSLQADDYQRYMKFLKKQIDPGQYTGEIKG